MTRRKSSSTPITSHTHQDKRANIPTEELRDFVADEEREPTTLLYPRDPSLDPQLVWTGKDEQDAADLAVPAVPVYIQEHIKPQAIVELVRAEAQQDQPAQLSLFGDFNGLSFEERVDFYHHEQQWTNRMILGDSLLVMTSLAEKEGLKGKVQMIYLDPPYGIRFGSNWQVSTRKRDVKDGRLQDATRQPEQIKAFRDTWQLGIHSYLAYLRDRLTVARELLTESGSVFVQIGDENVHLVRCLLDEVFGSENFCATIDFVKTAGQTSALPADVTDHILWYAKEKSVIKARALFIESDRSRLIQTTYGNIEQDGELRQLRATERRKQYLIPENSRILSLSDLTSQTGGASSQQIFSFQKKQFVPKGGRGWRTSQKGLEVLSKAERLFVKGDNVFYKQYFDDFPIERLANLWTDTQLGGFLRTEEKIYVVQTITLAIQRCLLMTTDPGDLVLDPTCGSGTTAYVAEQWGRRWITVDTSRVALALARTRLMAARYPYYLLADSPEGAQQEAGLTGRPAAIGDQLLSDIRKGFVYQRVPHITLKSIANNEEIDLIHETWQPRLDALRAEINQLAGKNWPEWEIPRLPSPYQSDKERADAEKSLRALGIVPSSPVWARLEEWQQARRQRQGEIDATIARRADVELLYDQPYEDRKRIRVSGPFTVESLSPHRVLAVDEDLPQSEVQAQSQSSQGFLHLILGNLKAAGVQNTVRNERLKFDYLEPHPGVWIHAAGEYTETPLNPPAGGGKPIRGEGVTRRVAVSIGPELGTVGPEYVKEAAKEAVQGLGFDLLLVCGFAFDPHVSEEAKRYGRLTVLPVRMNPDLAMGGDLLKKTGSGNLFMVFGEPDISLVRQADDRYTVTIHGVDVYDPTTGDLRSHNTDDIACWFIDTDYNGELFIVRHAYFTGADEPYKKLQRALRADIDEAAWSALYATTSCPFERPQSGKIAVKVINHYGDEVMKVYDLASD